MALDFIDRQQHATDSLEAFIVFAAREQEKPYTYVGTPPANVAQTTHYAAGQMARLTARWMGRASRPAAPMLTRQFFPVRNACAI